MTIAAALLRQGARDRMVAILDGFLPEFERVYLGEPGGLPPGTDRGIALWYLGRDTSQETLGNVMEIRRWRFAVYWRPRLGEAERALLEAAVEETDCDIQEAFRADSTLGGNVTDLKIRNSEGNIWEPVGEALYRVLNYELELWQFEAEAISP